MKLNFKLTLAVLSLSLGLTSQNTTLNTKNSDTDSRINKRGCATAVPTPEWDAWFNKKVEEFKANNPLGKTQNVSITIPVVVHVIHGGSNIGTFPNISVNQIRSQIAVLNKDFAGTGFNSHKLAATGFSTVGAANTNITFCLAQYDPSGNLLTTPGIDRVNYVTNGWTNPASPNTLATFQSLMDNTIKPATIWDPSSYFNIWVSDVHNNVGILGYATFPGGSTLGGLGNNTGNGSTDGIWVWARSFGNVGTLQAPYSLGRTATHETGHWLGLRHIGGDGNNNSLGDCNASDFCDDTPPQKGGFATGSFGQNFGAPNYPLHANSCMSGTNPQFGDMFMNFMDYTDDAINYMFTPDQNIRIQTAMQNGFFRNMLNASSGTLCVGMAYAEFTMDTIVCNNSEISPYNYTSGTPTITYAWSATPSVGVVFTPSATADNPSINFPATGYYTITMVATNTTGVSSHTMSVRIENCTGISDNNLDRNIRLSPNPSSGIINLSTSLSHLPNLKVFVHNSLGQLVLSESYTNSSIASYVLDLSSYPDGIYTVSISNGEEKVIKKLILSK